MANEAILDGYKKSSTTNINEGDGYNSLIFNSQNPSVKLVVYSEISAKAHKEANKLTTE